ncbi:MAG: hypothetical protein J6Y54_01850 [Lentisphaeria bacterium]|jgi:hypothetical protein|nr:hypothetical protein [Lentisphaeria bacterium]
MNGVLVQCPTCGKDIVPVADALETSIPPKTQETNRRTNISQKVNPPPAKKAEQPPPRVQNTPSTGNERDSLSTLLSSTDKNGNFKGSLLANMFVWAGILCFLLAIMIVIAFLILIGIDPKESSKGIASLISAIIGLLIAGMFHIGIGQIIHSIRRQDYNTERMVSLLQRIVDTKHK